MSCMIQRFEKSLSGNGYMPKDGLLDLKHKDTEYTKAWRNS